MSERGQAGTEAGQAGVSGAPGQQGEGAISWPRYRGTYRAAVVGHTGRGNYGHGMDLAFAGLPGVEVVAVADPDAAGRAAGAGPHGGPAGLRRLRGDAGAGGAGPAGRRAPAARPAGGDAAGGDPRRGQGHLHREAFRPHPGGGRPRPGGGRRAGGAHRRGAPEPGLPRPPPGPAPGGRGAHRPPAGPQGVREAGPPGRGPGPDGAGDAHAGPDALLLGDARWCHARVVDGGADATPGAVREGEEEVGPVAGDDIWAGYGFDGGVSGSYESARAARRRERERLLPPGAVRHRGHHLRLEQRHRPALLLPPPLRPAQPPGGVAGYPHGRRAGRADAAGGLPEPPRGRGRCTRRTS